MSGGLDTLRQELAHLEETLQAFDAPDVDEHPGLQLMAESLRERSQHVRRTIADAERSSLTVTLSGHAVADGSVPVDVAATVVTTLAEAVADAAAVVDADHGREAAALHLLEVTAGGDGVTLDLARPPGPLDGQLVDTESGGLVVDLAFEAVWRALSRGPDGSDDDPAAAAAGPAAGRLAAVLRAADLAAEIAFAPATRDACDVTLTGGALARLVAAAD